MNHLIVWLLFLSSFPAAFAAGPSGKVPPWEKPKTVARNLYLENCSICHDMAKVQTKKLGPSLVRFGTAPPAARESLRKYIIYKVRSGGIKMPAFGKTLSEDQIRRLADFLLPPS